MKKIALVAIAVLSLCLPLSGASKKKSKGPVTVEIWHTYTGKQAEFLNNIANSYNASQNKYKVEVKVQDYSGFNDTVYNAVANGVGPSIIFNYGTTAVDYANEGLAIDISKFIKQDSKKGNNQMKDLIDSLPDAMKVDALGFADGGIYYLPGCTTGPVYFYNKKIFDELKLTPPATWEELAQVSKTIKEKKGIPGFYSDGLVDNLQALIMQNGLGYIDTKNKKVEFCNDKMVEIYQWYADNCKKGYFAFNTVGRYASDDLGNGDIASFSGSCVNDQYVSFVEGKGSLGMSKWIGGNFYTVWNRGPIFLHRNDNVDKGTYDFIKYFFKEENISKWAITNSALCPYGVATSNKEYKDYLNNFTSANALPLVQENLSVSGSFPNVTGSAGIRKALEEYLNYVVDGKMTAKEAVTALEKACNDASNNR